MTTGAIADHVKFTPERRSSSSTRRYEAGYGPAASRPQAEGDRRRPPPGRGLEHDERYRRRAEFLQVLCKIWTEDDVDFRGGIGYFGTRVLPFVREIEDSEQDSIDSPVLVSA